MNFVILVLFVFIYYNLQNIPSFYRQPIQLAVAFCVTFGFYFYFLANQEPRALIQTP